LRNRQALVSRGGEDDLVTLSGEELREKLSYLLFVVDHQNLCHNDYSSPLWGTTLPIPLFFPSALEKKERWRTETTSLSATGRAPGSRPRCRGIARPGPRTATREWGPLPRVHAVWLALILLFPCFTEKMYYFVLSAAKPRGQNGRRVGDFARRRDCQGEAKCWTTCWLVVLERGSIGRPKGAPRVDDTNLARLSHGEKSCGT
jgi:hypothetical protein